MPDRGYWRNLTPIGQVREAGKRNPRCTLKELDCDHLELFMAAKAEEEFAWQLQFIRQTLAQN